MPDEHGNFTVDELLVQLAEYIASESERAELERPKPLCGPSCPWRPPITPEQRRAKLREMREARNEAIAFFRKRLNGEISWDVPARNPAFHGVCRWT